MDRRSYRGYYLQQDKTWRVRFPDFPDIVIDCEELISSIQEMPMLSLIKITEAIIDLIEVGRPVPVAQPPISIGRCCSLSFTVEVDIDDIRLAYEKKN